MSTKTKPAGNVPASTTCPPYVMSIASNGRLEKTTPIMLMSKAMETQMTVTDLDTLFTPGYYAISATTKGTFPKSFADCRWALVEVVVRGTDCFQRIQGLDFIAVRRSSVSAEKHSGAWRIIEMQMAATEVVE